MTTSPQDRLARRLTEVVRGTAFGPVRWVEETGSTNADLLAAAREGAPSGAVLVADHQTAGRGRRGRDWLTSPGDALLISVLLRPDRGIEPGWLVSATSVAVVDTVRGLGVDAGIKWPNDIVVGPPGGDRKLAGILAESVVSGGRIQAVVIGVGCNVAPGAAAGVAGATSIEESTGHQLDRVELLGAVLQRLDALLLSGAAAIVEQYRSRSATLGREVRVELDHETFAGVALDVDTDGALVVDHGGETRVVTAGEVIHLRPYSAPEPE